MLYIEFSNRLENTHSIIVWINDNKWKQIWKTNLKSIEIIRVVENRVPGHFEASEKGYVARLLMIHHDSWLRLHETILTSRTYY